MNRDARFNLVDERWIPVIWLNGIPAQMALASTANPDRVPWTRVRARHVDGSRSEIGIRDAFSYAADIREIYDDSPLVTFSIHRLLLAVLHAAGLHGETADVAHGADHYLTKWSHRFDLFDDTHPFFQDVQLRPLLDAPQKTKRKEKSVLSILSEAPKDTGISHFMHARDFETGLTPAECARGIITQPAFTSAGGRGFKPSINGVPPVYLYPCGRTLLDTLRLNLPEHPRQQLDKPLWEGEASRGEDVGPLEAFTWGARAMLLAKPVDALVRRIVYNQGRDAEDVNKTTQSARHWEDPHAAALRPKVRMKKEFTRLFAPKPLQSDGGAHAWRRIIADVVGFGPPQGLERALKYSRNTIQHVEAVLLPSDGKAKFYAAFAIRLQPEQVAPNDAGALLASLNTAHELSKRALWANSPKRRSARETSKRLAQFNPFEYEHQLALILSDGQIPNQEALQRCRADCVDPLARTAGLGWRRVQTAASQQQEEVDNAASNRYRFVSQLQDRTTFGPAELGLLRRARSGCESETVALTDLLNKHVREFGVHRRTAWMLARLYAHHPHQGHPCSFGKLIDRLRPRGSDEAARRERNRFFWEVQALLAAPLSQLETRLSRFVYRLRAARIPVDWCSLLGDLDRWEHTTQPIQSRWRAECLYHEPKQARQKALEPEPSSIEKTIQPPAASAPPEARQRRQVKAKRTTRPSSRKARR